MGVVSGRAASEVYLNAESMIAKVMAPTKIETKSLQ
jgi:hypothetical protein